MARNLSTIFKTPFASETTTHVGPYRMPELSYQKRFNPRRRKKIMLNDDGNDDDYDIVLWLF
jgi:hypothetical protein